MLGMQLTCRTGVVPVPVQVGLSAALQLFDLLCCGSARCHQFCNALYKFWVLGCARQPSKGIVSAHVYCNSLQYNPSALGQPPGQQCHRRPLLLLGLS